MVSKSDDFRSCIQEPDSPAQNDPERLPLFGGISGLPISIPEFVLCEGLVLRETYAHVMAPYIVAFKQPNNPGEHHPGPWKAAGGGLGFDVTIEVSLTQGSRPTGLNRLNTLWWVIALLRLATGAPLRMPVISDTAFAAIPSSTEEPMLWTLEMPPHQYRVSRLTPEEVTAEHLEWVRGVFLEGAELLDNDEFNRSFQTFDSAIWANSAGSAIIMAWAALETLYRPGRKQITKILATYIASFLHSAGPERDRAFQKIRELYETRGAAVHGSQMPEAEQLLSSFELARLSISKCLKINELPNGEELTKRWKDSNYVI